MPKEFDEIKDAMSRADAEWLADALPILLGEGLFVDASYHQGMDETEVKTARLQKPQNGGNFFDVCSYPEERPEVWDTAEARHYLMYNTQTFHCGWSCTLDGRVAIDSHDYNICIKTENWIPLPEPMRLHRQRCERISRNLAPICPPDGSGFDSEFCEAWRLAAREWLKSDSHRRKLSELLSEWRAKYGQEATTNA